MLLPLLLGLLPLEPAPGTGKQIRHLDVLPRHFLGTAAHFYF
jgi:hypothetical protein